jgi:hypothetical protein
MQDPDIAQLAIPDVPTAEDEVEVVAAIVHVSMVCLRGRAALQCCHA